ncbi:SirB2 family protein [Winslowiella iniecta]|uniref:Siroheme synthase n=1 Tax=Winslowiella iniecta TaxID=1560201 RepID=A0A0L7THT4_9GAMM|nr:SirB2 family protein [Winslowiella iniecta]KOC91951.1 siroheme synthase [Winslowiella iniecta]KOC94927.1 siroheme synthase [Winslowiella iniecta]
MAAYYGAIKHFHLLTVAITITMFILRFYWLQAGSAMLQRRWVRIVPHLNDTLLFISGILLVNITHFYPFSPQGSWLTEKLFGVIIYIVLGAIVLGRRPRANKVRWVAFLVALVVIFVIIKLATSKVPLLGIV